MGLNIIIQNKKGHEHPDWDSSRYSGDRDFVAMIHKLPHSVENTARAPDYEPLYRPTDFAAWREAIAKVEWPNPGRCEKMIYLLEANPEFFIYVSY